MKNNGRALALKKARTFVNKIFQHTLLHSLKISEKIHSEPIINFLEKKFITPKKYRRSPQEVKILGTAHTSTLSVGDENIVLWSWGNGPKVLLAHGWSGRGGQFHPWISSLVEQGFQVIAYDAPGHGDSTGNTSALPRFVDTIETIIKSQGPFYAVIGHSLGGAAAILSTARGIDLPKIISIAAPGDIQSLFFRTFQQKMGFHPRVIEGIQNRLKWRYQISMQALEPLNQTPRMNSDLLLWHDINDQEVPWSEAERLFQNSPKAILKTIRGPGHYRILRDQTVISESLNFLTGRQERRLESPHMDLILGKTCQF